MGKPSIGPVLRAAASEFGRTDAERTPRDYIVESLLLLIAKAAQEFSGTLSYIGHAARRISVSAASPSPRALNSSDGLSKAAADISAQRSGSTHVAIDTTFYST